MSKERFDKFIETTYPNALDYGNLEHARKRVSEYVYNEFKGTAWKCPEDFYIEVQKGPDNHYNFNPSKSPCTIKLADGNATFENRLYIANFLGATVIHWVPELKKTEPGKSPSIPPLSDQESLSIIYFSERLLKCCAGKNNGSILRKNYTLTHQEVEENIKAQYPGYDEKRLDKPQKAKIDTLFDEIFPVDDYQNNEFVGLLCCDIKNAEKHLSIKIDVTTGPGISRFGDVFVPLIRGKTLVSNTTKPATATAYYPSLDDIKHSPKISWSNEEAKTLVRYILAHELSHLLHHYDPEINVYDSAEQQKKAKPEEEEAAVLGALKLLEKRELAYNKGNADSVYENACDKIRSVIFRYHAGRPWIGNIQKQPYFKPKKI